MVLPKLASAGVIAAALAVCMCAGEAWAQAQSVPRQSWCGVQSSNNTSVASLGSLLGGQLLTVGVHEYGDFVSVTTDSVTGEQIIGGYCMDLLESLSTTLGFQYEVTLLSKPQNSTFDQELLTEAANFDVIGGWWYDTFNRRSKGLMASPYSVVASPQMVALKASVSNSDYWTRQIAALFVPFHWSLWLVLLVSIGVISLFMYWLERDDNPAYTEVDRTKGILRALWRGYASYITMYMKFSPVTTNGAIYSIMYVYCIRMFWAGYSAHLTTQLWSLNEQQQYTSVEVVVTEGAVACMDLSTAAASLLRQTYPNLQIHGISDLNEVPALLADGTCQVGIGALTEMELLVAKNCDLEMAGTTIGGFAAGAGYAASTADCGTDLIGSLNTGFLYLQEQGVVDKLWNAYILTSCTSSSSSTANQMDLVESSGLFAIIIVTTVGTGVATIHWRRKFLNKVVDAVGELVMLGDDEEGKLVTKQEEWKGVKNSATYCLDPDGIIAKHLLRKERTKAAEAAPGAE